MIKFGDHFGHLEATKTSLFLSSTSIMELWSNSWCSLFASEPNTKCKRVKRMMIEKPWIYILDVESFRFKAFWPMLQEVLNQLRPIEYSFVVVNWWFCFIDYHHWFTWICCNDILDIIILWWKEIHTLVNPNCHIRS